MKGMVGGDYSPAGGARGRAKSLVNQARVGEQIFLGGEIPGTSEVM